MKTSFVCLPTNRPACAEVLDTMVPDCDVVGVFSLHWPYSANIAHSPARDAQLAAFNDPTLAAAHIADFDARR